MEENERERDKKIMRERERDRKRMRKRGRYEMRQRHTQIKFLTDICTHKMGCVHINLNIHSYRQTL